MSLCEDCAQQLEVARRRIDELKGNRLAALNLADDLRKQRDETRTLAACAAEELRRAVEAAESLKADRDALLAALRDLADTNNDFSEALIRARLAIARATTEKP